MVSVIREHLTKIIPEAISIRQQLHTIPELKYQEFKTAKLISQTLAQYGYAVETQIAGTGVVAILDCGKPGKTIALRADMDALPIDEPKTNLYCSQHAGAMHACGHDGHCATLLAVAYVLSKMKGSLKGKVKLIFQPAEEGGKGSTAMIEAGVLDNPPVDKIYGYHNWPGMAEGVIATKGGTILLGNGRIEIDIQGKPAHTAQPEKAINPVIIGAQLIQHIESLRLSLQSEGSVLTALAFNSGDFTRGMTTSAKLIVLYYTETDTNLERIKNELTACINELCKVHGCDIKCAYYPFHSPTVNSVKESKKALEIFTTTFGIARVRELTKSMLAAEDFSVYLQHVPGCFFLVGAGEEAKPVHTAEFAFNDKLIAVAAEAFCQLVVSELGT